MTALDRRLQKMEEGLSPTEAVVRWLEEAKGSGSYAASITAIKEHRLADPYTTLPRVVAAWVERTAESRHDRSMSEKTERAVRAAIVRLVLIERTNRLLMLGLPGDVHQVELLQLLKPFVLTGRTEEAAESAWVEHAGRLVDEARLWSEGSELIARRYLAGHTPLFPDVLASLNGVRQEGEELLWDYNAAATRSRGRKPHGEPVDLGRIDQHVADLLEAHVDALVQGSRLDAEAFLGERSRKMRIERLIGWED